MRKTRASRYGTMVVWALRRRSRFSARSPANRLAGPRADLFLEGDPALLELLSQEGRRRSREQDQGAVIAGTLGQLLLFGDDSRSFLRPGGVIPLQGHDHAALL